MRPNHMEALRRIFRQYADLFRSLSVSQRGTIIIGPLMVVAALGFLTVHNGSASYVALSWGKTFNTEELTGAERTLKDAGLNDFRRDGRRILVPADRVDEYNAALLKSGTLPTDWASELEQQLQQDSLLTTNRQLQMRKQIALAKAAGRMIGAIPEIEEATVIPAPAEKRSGFGRDVPEMTATVSVKPRPDEKLSLRLVHSVQQAVANMFPGLDPEHVTVLDQSTGTAYTGEDRARSFDGRLLARIQQFEQMYQERIAGALSWIPGVVVTVNVHPESPHLLIGHRPDISPGGPSPHPPSKVIPSNEGMKGTGDEGPRSVEVSVAIPENYYRKVARSRGWTGGKTEEQRQRFQSTLTAIEKRVREDVRSTVRKHIPAGSPEEAVTVTSYVSADPSAEDIDRSPHTPRGELLHAERGVHLPVADTVSHPLSRWGGPFGLVLFAVWGVWTLTKNTRKRPKQFEPDVPPAERVNSLSEEQEDEKNRPSDTQTIGQEAGPIVRQSDCPIVPLPATPFAFLQDARPEDLISLIVEEHPQTIALVLSHVSDELSAEVLGGLPADQQTDVIRRMANIEQTSPEVIRDVEAGLENRMACLFTCSDESPESRVESPEPSAGISGAAESCALDSGLSSLDSFEDLQTQDDRTVQTLLDEIDIDQWAVALKGASETTKQKIVNNLTRQNAEQLQRDMEQLGPVTVSQVEQTQQQIVEAVRHQLDECGSWIRKNSA